MEKNTSSGNKMGVSVKRTIGTILATGWFAVLGIILYFRF